MNYKKLILLFVAIIYMNSLHPMVDNHESLLNASLYETVTHMKVVKDMLANKANPNVQDYNGRTALHTVCAGCKAEYAPLLLDANANPHIVNRWGYSALHIAIWYNNTDLITVLLKAKADTNLASTSCKKTPFHYSISLNNSTDTISLLLAAQANLNFKTRKGRTALHIAVNHSYKEMVNVVQLLLQNNADVSALDDNKQTPLQLLFYNYTLVKSSSKNTSKPSPLLAQKMGRLLVWYQYMLLPYFTKLVPTIIPQKEIACAIASHLALHLAENKTIW